jgi:hypothetical protein
MATQPSSYFSEMTTRLEIDKILRKGQGFTCKDMPDHVTEKGTALLEILVSGGEKRRHLFPIAKLLGSAKFRQETVLGPLIRWLINHAC